MINKSERTVEVYRRAGAEMRLFKALCAKLAVDISEILYAAEQDKLMMAMRKIDEVCSEAKENMFRDHPALSNEYLDVFYGGISSEPRNEVDREVIEIARNIANELFERKNH